MGNPFSAVARNWNWTKIECQDWRREERLWQLQYSSCNSVAVLMSLVVVVVDNVRECDGDAFEDFADVD